MLDLAEQLYSLGQQQYLLEDYDAAAATLERAADLLDTLTPALVRPYARVTTLWARSAARQGDFDVASEVLDRAQDTVDTAEATHAPEQAMIDRYSAEIDELWEESDS